MLRQTFLILLIGLSNICRSQILISEGQNSLAEKLLFELCKETEFNCIFSPYTITQSLVLLIAGTDGFTQQQIVNALNLDRLTPQEITEMYSNLKIQLHDSNFDNDLLISNLLCINEELQIQENFEENYQEEILQVDFQSPKLATNEINQLINQTTEGKIPTFLPINAISETFQSILVDAIFFKGQWQYQFENVTRENFFLEVDFEKKVDMMQLNNIELLVGDFRELGVGVVRLPFENSIFNSNMEMFIILPEFYPVENNPGIDAFNMEKVIESLSSPGAIQTVLEAEYTNKEISLLLPRFSLTQATRIGRLLERLGVKEIFIPSSADFSPITNSSNFFVNEGFHETQIEIDEEGIQIYNYSNTNIQDEDDFLFDIETVFRVDRPFLFLLVDSQTNSVVIMGVVMDPSKK